MPFELPAEVASSVPAEHLGHPSVAKYNSFGDFVKGHIDAQEHIGRSLVMPNGESKPEELDKWASEQSVKLKERGYTIAKASELPPEKPDAYQFKVEGMTDEQLKTDKGIAAFKAIAHRHGLGNAKAQALINEFLKDVAPTFREGMPPPAEFLTPDDVKALNEKNFGKDHENVIKQYGAAIKAIMVDVPELASLPDILNESVASIDGKYMALGDHPVIVRLINEVAKMKQPDFGGNVQGDTVLGDAAAKAEAEDISRNKDNPKYKLYHSGDQATKDYVNNLWKKAFGEKEVIINDAMPKIVDRT